MNINIDFDFDRYPTLLKFAQEDAHFKVVIGPTGSAKTSAVSVLAFYDAIRQAPHTDGIRRTKTLIVRNTFAQLEANTIESWRQMLGGIIKFVGGNRPSGLCRFPLGDGTTVEWKIQFLALESPNVEDDIVGLEITNIVFEELMKMENMDRVLAVVSRVGRYPSMKLGGATNIQCWGSANGPLKSHWLYDVHIGKYKAVLDDMSKSLGRPFIKIFKQPSGLIKKPNGTYDPNPLAENIHNLKQGYGTYYQQLTRSDSDITAYVMGDFADLVVGKTVYPQFRRDLHVVSYENMMIKWGKQGEIGATFDFGRTPVCLLYIRNHNGSIVIFEEIAAEGSSIESLYDNHIAPVLKQKYRNTWISNATGDPAGADGNQATEASPYGVLRKKGVPIAFPAGTRKDLLNPRIEALRQRMMRLDETGTPMLRITDNCKLLIDALTSGYIFEQVENKNGVFREIPTKTHKNFASDLANALEYLALFTMGDNTPRRDNNKKIKSSYFA